MVTRVFENNVLGNGRRPWYFRGMKLPRLELSRQLFNFWGFHWNSKCKVVMYPKASHNQVIHHIQLSHWDQVVGTNNKYQAAFRNQSQCLALNHIRNELVQNAIHHSQHSNCECNDLRAFAPNPTRSQPSTTGCNLSLPDS